MSADDGIRTLYLDFGGPEGELVRRGASGFTPRFGRSSSRGVAPASPPSLRHHGYVVPAVGRPQPWLRDPRCPPRGFGVPVVGLTPFSISPPPPGAGPALLPQAHRLHPAHLPLGQSHPHGAAGIGGPGPHHKPAGDSGGAPPSPLQPHQCLAGAGTRCPESHRGCGRTAVPGWGGEPLLLRAGGPGPPTPAQGGTGAQTPALTPPWGLKPSLISPPVPWSGVSLTPLPPTQLGDPWCSPHPHWGEPAPSLPWGSPQTGSHCPCMGRGLGHKAPPHIAAAWGPLAPLRVGDTHLPYWGPSQGWTGLPPAPGCSSLGWAGRVQPLDPPPCCPQTSQSWKTNLPWDRGAGGCLGTPPGPAPMAPPPCSLCPPARKLLPGSGPALLGGLTGPS